jgi:hypothetical protein
MITNHIYRKPPECPEDASPYGLSQHEWIINEDHKVSVKEEWIQYMINYYRKAIVGFPDTCYRKWAEHKIDGALEGLGDYFSRSHYEKE